MIGVELNMLVGGRGVEVVIGGFDEETIDKASLCVIVAPLPRECSICWNI